MKYCKKCGTANLNEADMCSFCHSALPLISISSIVAAPDKTTLVDLEKLLRDRQNRMRTIIIFILSIIFTAVVAVQLIMDVQSLKGWGAAVTSLTGDNFFDMLIILCTSEIIATALLLLICVILLITALILLVNSDSFALARFKLINIIRVLRVFLLILFILFSALFAALLVSAVIYTIKSAAAFNYRLAAGAATVIAAITLLTFLFKQTSAYRITVLDEMIEEREIINNLNIPSVPNPYAPDPAENPHSIPKVQQLSVPVSSALWDEPGFFDSAIVTMPAFSERDEDIQKLIDNNIYMINNDEPVDD